ncbi:MAG: hypothetical protein NTZ09_05975 [Candidatus Hydrogenedentes bacterium]|nr:hypothetical protein [Candidatus Hydrogenedentota bacterium]
MFGFGKKKDLRETADQEKAAKLVVEINERALASGGYVNTYALSLRSFN